MNENSSGLVLRYQGRLRFPASVGPLRECAVIDRLSRRLLPLDNNTARGLDFAGECRTDRSGAVLRMEATRA